MQFFRVKDVLLVLIALIRTFFKILWHVNRINLYLHTDDRYFDGAVIVSVRFITDINIMTVNLIVNWNINISSIIF